MHSRNLIRIAISVLLGLLSFHCTVKETKESAIPVDSVETEMAVPDHTETRPIKPIAQKGEIETGMITRDELVSFAKTQIGVPYLYASTDPSAGFDCSGFITYVFNHFNIAVPRSSIDFTNEGTEVDTSAALPGDLILFTGTDSTDRNVGHMGIVVKNQNGKLEFIHSTSGKAKGVVITPFERYYRTRFVKVIRVFPE